MIARGPKVMLKIRSRVVNHSEGDGNSSVGRMLLRGVIVEGKQEVILVVRRA